MIIIYSEASGESCLNIEKWPWLQFYAVETHTANADLFFCYPPFCSAWILQQVCSSFFLPERVSSKQKLIWSYL